MTEGEEIAHVGSSHAMYGRGGWARRIERRLAWSDSFVIVVVMVGAHAARFGWDPLAAVAGPSATPYWQVSVSVAVLWALQLGWARSREPRVLGHGPKEFQRVLIASWRTFAIVAIVGFLTQWQISRGYLLFALPLGAVVLVVYRAAWRKLIHAQRDRGDLLAQVLVAGPARTSEQMIRRLQRNRRAGYNVIGACVPGGSRARKTPLLEGVRVAGSLEDTAEVAMSLGAEYVLLSGSDAMSLREARQLGWELEGTGIGLIVAPALVDVAGPRVSMTPVEGLPLIHVEAPQFTGSQRVAKEIFDRASALAFLFVGGIPMLVIAAAIRLSSPGPALFRQVRVGRDHQLFTMYKFRSMYVDAEERLALLAGQSDGNGVLFKMHDDPRVTRIGRVLRRFSLDELPQLLNVLKGDMSMVGPRPPLPREVEQWDERVSRRQLVKPGVTGLWQVSGRSDLSWDEAVRLDLYYTENWSLASDAVIVLRTLGAIFFGRGAY